jgi:hypothetical protein
VEMRRRLRRVRLGVDPRTVTSTAPRSDTCARRSRPAPPARSTSSCAERLTRRAAAGPAHRTDVRTAVPPGARDRARPHQRACHPAGSIGRKAAPLRIRRGLLRTRATAAAPMPSSVRRRRTVARASGRRPLEPRRGWTRLMNVEILEESCASASAGHPPDP